MRKQLFRRRPASRVKRENTAAQMALCAYLALRESTQLKERLLAALRVNSTTALPPALTVRQENTAIRSLNLPQSPLILYRVGLAVQESSQNPPATKPNLVVCHVLQGPQAQILVGILLANLALQERQRQSLGLKCAPAALQAPFLPLLAL